MFGNYPYVRLSVRTKIKPSATLTDMFSVTTFWNKIFFSIVAPKVRYSCSFYLNIMFSKYAKIASLFGLLLKYGPNNTVSLLFIFVLFLIL